MKYKNAQEILPDELLKELQRYVQGEMLYIPDSGERKSWGEVSGARDFYKKRNEKIRRKYLGGTKVEHLAEEFSLSVDSIKKIVYQAK